ncbi:MAG: hypothetical protein MJ221_03005 [Bacilli bacterium]|nr:hypothetical protein [Bacilli bacterium]
MGFLRWMEQLPKWARILISLIAGWRAYAIVKAILNHESLVEPIIFAVLAFVFGIIDLVLNIVQDHPFRVEFKK